MMEAAIFLALCLAYMVLAGIGLIVVVRRIYRLLAHAMRRDEREGVALAWEPSAGEREGEPLA